MHKRMPALIIVACAASACTPVGQRFEDRRTVFNNPYVSPELDSGPVGPECSQGVIRDNKCWIDGVGYPLGRGFVFTPDGDIVRLSGRERRFLRERVEALQAKADVLKSLEEGTPLPADSPALPENQGKDGPS